MKSYQKIETAAKELVKTKKFENITVKMICQWQMLREKLFMHYIMINMK